MSKPLISVIIPCYNYAVFLEHAVNSVIAQTYESWECLIVDDGSVDETAAVAGTLARADLRVKYYYKINGGLSSARNFGLEKASGDYICFLDADDLFDAQKLEIQIRYFENNPGTDIVYGKAMFFEKNDRSVLYLNKEKSGKKGPAVVSGSGMSFLKPLITGNIMVVSAPLLKRKVFEKAGGFDISYRSYEDWQFWIKCALAGFHIEFCPEPEVCTYIRFGHESMMSDKKKLLNAGIQLRAFLMPHLSFRMMLYNRWRLMRSKIKRTLI